MIHYLGIYINSHLKWNDHVKHIVARASCSLNFLRQTLNGCSSYVKASTYKCIAQRSIEYASSAWFLHAAGDRIYLDAVQNRAACWACGSIDSVKTSRPLFMLDGNILLFASYMIFYMAIYH